MKGPPRGLDHSALQSRIPIKSWLAPSLKSVTPGLDPGVHLAGRYKVGLPGQAR